MTNMGKKKKNVFFYFIIWSFRDFMVLVLVLVLVLNYDKLIKVNISQ